MNNLVNNASALSLTSERLKVFTRYEACKCKAPPHKKNSNSAVRKFPQMPPLISPCKHTFLPPKEKSKIMEEAGCHRNCFRGLFRRNQLQLYEARRVRKFVRQ